MKRMKKVWALVLALVMVLALGVTAWATETVEVPGGNPLPPGNEPTTVTDDVPFTKKVELAGAGTIPAATFTFELTDPNGRSLSDYGIAVSNNTVTLAENETSKETAFTVTVVDAGTIMQTWDSDGSGWRKEFSLTEKNDGEDGWTYDSNSVTVALMYNNEANRLSHNREEKVFTNVYTPAAPTTTIKIPFTKVVKLGGNREPGSQSFELEIFNIGNSNTSEYANVTYTAKVETKGEGTYKGEIVITGPENEVAQYTSEGFYVREKNTGADKWTYSNAVWHVNPDLQNRLITYPATKQTTPNGDYYEDGDAAAMTFTNVYTRNYRNITPSDPTPDPTPDEQFVSPKTFDAGIGLYAVSALLSVTGGAWVVGKKRK